MALTAYPGLLAGSSPIPSLYITPLATPGKVLYVHSGRGSNDNVGNDDRYPRASVVSALTQCRDSRGDQIWCLPGHTESITAAGGWALANVGVSIFGLGEQGGDQPTITFTTAAAATMLVTGASCRVSNLCFDLTGVASLTAPLAIQAAGFRMTDCRIIGANATNQAVLAVLTTAAANRLRISRCRFEGTSDAGMTAAITLVGGDSAVIEDCDFYGAYGQTVGAIRSITTLCTNCNIINNRINNRTAGSTKAITMLTGSTGNVVNNRMQILSGTAPLTADAMTWMGNYYAAAIATSGTLL
jgi:hypothetical protein